MLDKLKGIEDRYEQIGNELLEVGANYQRAGELNKERVDLEPVYQKTREYRQAVKSFGEAKTILETEKDSELVALAKADMEDLAPKIEILEKQIRGLLIPKDPRDDKNVYVEIRAGAGGDGSRADRRPSTVRDRQISAHGRRDDVPAPSPGAPQPRAA